LMWPYGYWHPPWLSPCKATVLKAMCSSIFLFTWLSFLRTSLLASRPPDTLTLIYSFWHLSLLSFFFTQIIFSWQVTLTLFMNTIYFHYFFWIFLALPIILESPLHLILTHTCLRFLSHILLLIPCSIFSRHKTHSGMMTEFECLFF
jgi:hypothetical protein